MTYASNNRALARLESKSGSKESSLSRFVGMIEQAREERRRATLALAAFAQELAGVEPSAAAPEPARDEASTHVEPSPVRRRESPPLIIAGSPNDPNSSAYMRPWVQDTVEAPEVPDGPEVPSGPWAHWGFERRPSYDREQDDAKEQE